MSQSESPLLESADGFWPRDYPTDYGMIAEFPDMIIIGFCGTKAPTTAGGVKAWISDFDAYPLQSLPLEKMPEFKRAEILRHYGILKDGPWGKGTIHDGFYTAWMLFKEQFTTVLKAIHKDKEILVVGKSRGGSLATLCARHIAKNIVLPNKVGVITFGAPSVGISAFRDQYEHLGIYTTRCTYGVDVVPTMPPYGLGFRHVGRHLYLPCARWQRIPPMRLIYRFVHHTNKYYGKGVRKFNA